MTSLKMDGPDDGWSQQKTRQVLNSVTSTYGRRRSWKSILIVLCFQDTADSDCRLFTRANVGEDASPGEPV